MSKSTAPLSKPTIYTAFANSVDPDQFLPNLSEEAFRIADLMQGLAFNDKLYYVKDELFNPDRLIHNFSRYGERFTLFYFSGHAKKDHIKLAGNQNVGAIHMAKVINSNLTNLEFAFFNACETLDLARAIVKGRLGRGYKHLTLISSPREVNTYIAERFATLVFTQIGQPGTYYDAYQQAKDLVQMVDPQVSFREVASLEELESDLSAHHFCYVEVKNGKVVVPGANKRKKPAPSIIGSDKVVSDALSANYMKEVVQTIGKSRFPKGVVSTLQEALTATRQVMEGIRKPKDVAPLLKQAAQATPGLQSAAPFQALINMEKHRNAPFVASFKPLRETSISGLQEALAVEKS